MVFGELINRQTSQIEQRQYCPDYYEQNLFLFYALAKVNYGQ